MAKSNKTEYGTMPCRECGHPVKVMKNEQGGLSYTCAARGCDDTDYAKTGSLKLASWNRRIQKFEDTPEGESGKPAAPAMATEQPASEVQPPKKKATPATEAKPWWTNL